MTIGKMLMVGANSAGFPNRLPIKKALPIGTKIISGNVMRGIRKELGLMTPDSQNVGGLKTINTNTAKNNCFEFNK